MSVVVPKLPAPSWWVHGEPGRREPGSRVFRLPGAPLSLGHEGGRQAGTQGGRTTPTEITKEREKEDKE